MSIYIPANTTVYTSKIYRQCLGTACHGTGKCSSCGSEVGTGGICLAMIEITTTPASISVRVAIELVSQEFLMA